MGTNLSDTGDLLITFFDKFTLHIVLVSQNPCRLNWSMQHHLIGMIFLKVVFMAQGKLNRLSAKQRADNGQAEGGVSKEILPFRFLVSDLGNSGSDTYG